MSERSAAKLLVKDLFDSKAELWNDKYMTVLRGRIDLFARLLTSHIGEPSRVIDYGCGGGALGEALTKPVTDLVSVDISMKMAGICARFLKEHGRTARVVCGDLSGVRAMPFADLVICSSVIEYIPDVNQFLSDIALRMMPGGILLASVPHRKSNTRRLEAILRPIARLLVRLPLLPPRLRLYCEYLVVSVHRFIADEFAKRATAAGFTVCEVVTYSMRNGLTVMKANGAMLCFVLKHSDAHGAV